MANEEKKKLKSYLSLLIRIGIAVLACWLIFKELDFRQLGQTITQLHIWTVTLLLAVFCAALCVIGFRWWLFMRVQAIHIPLFLAIKLTFLGQFFTNFLPSAVGGDLIRAWYVSRHTHKKLQAALGVAVDRFMGLLSTFVLATTSYLLFMRGQGVLQVTRRSEGAIETFFNRHPVNGYQVLLAVLILIGTGFVLSSIFDLKRYFKTMLGHLLHAYGQFKIAFLTYYHHPLIFIFGLSITVFLQSMIILSFWLVGQDLGMTAGIRYYFVFFPLIWVVGAIPLSPAGIGILEGGLVFLFVQFTGAESESAMALALCQRLIWIIASIPGLFVHLAGSHRLQEQSC